MESVVLFHPVIMDESLFILATMQRDLTSSTLLGLPQHNSCTFDTHWPSGFLSVAKYACYAFERLAWLL